MNNKQFPENLLNGYRDFHAGRYAQDIEHYHQLAESGQTPKIMVIACCDSRTAPETVFNSGPGEIFVVRNVANMVPPHTPDGAFHSTSAALEFAVQVLKVKHIVVFGHGQCGGIRAALHPEAKPLSPGDFIGKWMELLKPAAKEINQTHCMTQHERQTLLEHYSIRNSIANLKTFPCVDILSSKNRLQLHGAWFDIFSGELWVLDNETGDFSMVK